MSKLMDLLDNSKLKLNLADLILPLRLASFQDLPATEALVHQQRRFEVLVILEGIRQWTTPFQTMLSLHPRLSRLRILSSPPWIRVGIYPKLVVALVQDLRPTVM